MPHCTAQLGIYILLLSVHNHFPRPVKSKRSLSYYLFKSSSNLSPFRFRATACTARVFQTSSGDIGSTVVLLGLPHVILTPALLRGFPLLQLPCEVVACRCSYLVISHPVKSRFVPPTFPMYIETATIQTHCLPTRERGGALSDTTV